VPIDRLSDGQRDQLYFALRLAALERYADSGRAMPVLLDDVFINFDEAHTAAALTVLDEVSTHLQIVVFTHHARIAELAQAEMPAGRIHRHDLKPFTPGTAAG